VAEVAANPDPGRGHLWAELAAAYRDHGYIRRPVPSFQAAADTAHWAAVFVFRFSTEARRLHGLLRQAGFHPGEPVRQARLWTVRVPGILAVGCFRLLGVMARLPGFTDSSSDAGRG
jgi:hypothetical protein